MKDAIIFVLGSLFSRSSWLIIDGATHIGNVKNVMLSAALCWLLTDVVIKPQNNDLRTSYNPPPEKHKSPTVFLSLWFFKDLSNLRSKSILRKDCWSWHRMPLKLIQNYHIWISSFLFWLSLINEEVGVADLYPNPPFSWFSVENPCHLTPPRWFRLERSTRRSDAGSLAAINHGQARFHAHRSHTSSHSRLDPEQTVLRGAGRWSSALR